MALIDRIYDEVLMEWISSLARFENETGTLLVSAEANRSGELISDEYVLTVSGIAGGTGTITVTTSSDNNPYDNRVVNSVPLDGTTVVTNVIPGLDLVFSNSAIGADEAIVYVGSCLGVFDGVGETAGVPSAGIRHQVYNDGTSKVALAKARLLTQAVVVKKIGTVFSEVKPFAVDAVEKVEGGTGRIMPYVFSISDVSGAGLDKVATLSIDGVVLPEDSISNLNNGDITDGVGLSATEPGSFYKIILGDLEGLVFALSANCANGNTANVLIFPSRFIQIAPDISGTPGTYGIDDVNLTADGFPTGELPAEEEAYYWTRVLVPSGASNESNPYPGNVAIQSTSSSSAGWDE